MRKDVEGFFEDGMPSSFSFFFSFIFVSFFSFLLFLFLLSLQISVSNLLKIGGWGCFLDDDASDVPSESSGSESDYTPQSSESDKDEDEDDEYEVNTHYPSPPFNSLLCFFTTLFFIQVINVFVGYRIR